MKVRVNMGDWMLTMGMVGFFRIYDHGLTSGIISRENKVFLQIQKYGLEIDLRALEFLPEAFFDYMLSEYSIYKREQERLGRYLEFAKNKEHFNQNRGNIKRIINDNFKKIIKYFPGEITEQLKDIQADLKDVKGAKDYVELGKCVQRFLEIAKMKSIDEKLTLNYFKAVIMRPFFGQPSFLNVSKNNLTLKEQMELFYSDYIHPVLTEANFQDCLERAQDKKEVLDYLEKEKSHKPFPALAKALKKLKLEEMKKYLRDQIPRCSLLPKIPAFNNYEEMIFTPLGVSPSYARNFHWNMNIKQPTPISSLAKLILFCSPAGSAIYGRWDGQGREREYRTYAGFVQTEGAFTDVMGRNNSFKNHKNKNDPFDKIINVLIDDLKRKAGYVLEHLFFIEFCSDYESKRTLLEYYHLPQYLVTYIKTHGKELEKITPREQFVRSVLHGQDPIYVIWSNLNEQIINSYYTYGTYRAVRERNRIMFYRRYLGKEAKELKKQDRLIQSIYNSGMEIRRNFEEVEASKGEEEPYIASAGKKISGIAYRLLNTVKAGSKKEFMDSLFRLHMSIDKPINYVFLNALHEKELDFASVGSAFIAGLLSGESKDKKLNKEAN